MDIIDNEKISERLIEKRRLDRFQLNDEEGRWRRRARYTRKDAIKDVEIKRDMVIWKRQR